MSAPAREAFPDSNFAIAITPLFPVMWLLITYEFKFLTGWNRLEDRFASPKTPATYPWISGRIGFVGFDKGMNAALLADGVYLEWMWLFAFMKSPVLIPWSYVTSVQLAGWISKRLVIKLEAADVKMRLRLPREGLGHVPERMRPAA